MKIVYFNAPGRAWALRTCFKIANVAFEDEFLTFPELQAKRGPTGYSDEVPLGQLPLLILDNGERVTQSSAITRYAAKLAGLYPTDDHIKAMFIDEIVDVVNEAAAKAPQTSDIELKKKLREEYAKKDLVKYFTFLAKKLEKSTSKFIVGNTLSLADLYTYSLLRAIRTGTYDFVPSDSDAPFPIFQGYIEHLEADPVFTQYKY